MNWKKIDELPCVKAILQKAEQEIFDLTAAHVVLNVAVRGQAEDRKEILQHTVCTFFNVGWKDIASRSRSSEIIEPRHVYMYLAQALCGLTPGEAAADCGRRDRTTAIHAFNKIKGYYEVKDSYINKVEALISQLPKTLFQR